MVMVAKPIVPQTRIKFIGESRPRVKASAGETVALPIIHDWGPMGAEQAKPVAYQEFAEWTETFGDSDTEGRTAVVEAFAGQNTTEGGGAGAVIPYRMGVNAAKATITVQNTTPANAMVLTAKYRGTRGNDYSFTLDADPADAARDRFRLRYKGAVVATFTYTKTNVAALVSAINNRINVDLTATLVLSGVALTPTANTSLAGGTNGNAITSSDYLLALDGLEFGPFGLLAPYNLTDQPTMVAIMSWIRTQEDNNRPVKLVVGGAAGETVDDAIGRSIALADPHIVNFGVGTYRDDILNKDLSTAQLAPAIAGIMAARGEEAALTGALLGGRHLIGVSGAITAEVEAAVQQGVTVVIRTDDDEADLRVAKGVTTFTSTSDAARPVEIFSEPRFITIMDNFIRSMRRWGDKKIVGSVPVNQDSRDAVRQQAGILIDDLLRRGLILTKAQGAMEDPFVRTPVTTDDTLPFEFGWQFAYTANYLLGEGRVR